jgi:ubiquinone/menaquinone biosynthesis C-methylase UbiE
MTACGYGIYRQMKAKAAIWREPDDKRKAMTAYELMDGMIGSPSRYPFYGERLVNELTRASGDERGVLVSLGGGCGRIEKKLEKRGFEVVNVDLYAADLGRCVKSHPRVHCVRADAEALPIRDGCAKATFSSEAIGHMNPQKAYNEMERVMADGGVSQVSTYKNAGFSKLDVFKIYKLHEASELVKAAEAAGLEDVGVKELTALSSIPIPRKMIVVSSRKTGKTAPIHI